jgi:hypothetical protein
MAANMSANRATLPASIFFMPLPYFHYYRIMEDVKKKTPHRRFGGGAAENAGPPKTPGGTGPKAYARSQFRAARLVNIGPGGLLRRHQWYNRLLCSSPRRPSAW